MVTEVKLGGVFNTSIEPEKILIEQLKSEVLSKMAYVVSKDFGGIFKNFGWFLLLKIVKTD
jgi:hypothetical protein